MNTAERLIQITHAMPERLQAEVLDFAEFLNSRRAVVSASEPTAAAGSLWNLAGGLENSRFFQGDPVLLQRAMRDEWH